MASAKDENCISPYRRLLLDMSMELSNKDLERLIYAVGDHLPRRLTENIESGLKLFEALEQDVHIGPQNLTLLHDGFKTIGRMDLAQRIQVFPRKLHRADETDDGRDDMVTDGVGDGSDPEPKGSDLPYTGARKAAADEHVMTFRSVVDQPHPANPRSTSTGLSGGDADGRTAEHLVAVRSDALLTVTNNGSSLEFARGPCSTPSRAFVHKSSARLQPDPAVGPAPPQYVDFLLHEDYVVKILGGKHFKTPGGEFVELKSGTQYAIHVKNCHAYGCHVDISIDGYDVGGWALRGGEEISIERPANETKKFTFYRVITAPKEAGIESGRPENGVVKCVFTPEAFLNIPVITSDSSQPLNVSIPPSATVGELKRKLQHQMGVMDDPYQVLAKSDKVLTNGTRLRGILEKLTDLRLIDAEITITVTAEASSSFPFPIGVHPGKVKVHYLMEQIEEKIQVPIRDQKLYHEGNLLSAAPSSYLPDKLICSPHPAVNVIIPEYIHITVKDQSGHSHSVKVDKEKNLEAVMEEIPSSSYLQVNEEATFAFNGKQLFPSKDKGTLASLGICSGSKLELTVRALYIEVKVFFSDNSSSVSVKCDPQETFLDLVEKILKRRNSSKCRLTFAMDGREFDPDQDKGPLQDYGVTHGRRLRVTSYPTSVSTGDRILDGSQVLGAVGRSRFKPVDSDSSGDELNFASLRRGRSRLEFAHSDSSEEDESCGFSGIFDGRANVVEPDPAWRSGGTTLQGHSTQQFTTAEPIGVDHSRRVELVLRLVARDGEKDLEFPKGECKPLSTLTPPPVQE